MRIGNYSKQGSDKLIGWLVVFNKKAENGILALAELEGKCCDAQLHLSDTMTTTDSSIVPNHPAYLRHKDSVIRSRRGRSTTPVRERASQDSSTGARRPPLRRHRIHDNVPPSDPNTHNIGEHVKIVVGREKGKTGHVILVAATVVEVVMDDTNDHKYFSSDSVQSCETSIDLIHVSSSSFSAEESHGDVEFLQSALEESQQVVYHSQSFSVLDQIPANSTIEELPQKWLSVNTTLSPFSAFIPLDPPGVKTFDVGRRAGKLTTPPASNPGPVQVTSPSNSQMPKNARPPKPTATPTVQGFNLVKSRIPANVRKETVVLNAAIIPATSRSISSATSCFHSETKSECASMMSRQKPKSVGFQEPIQEMIPLKATSFVAGDLVYIIEGMHKNNTGCVVKVTAELVQVRVGGFVQPFYLSTRMLRIHR